MQFEWSGHSRGGGNTKTLPAVIRLNFLHSRGDGDAKTWSLRPLVQPCQTFTTFNSVCIAVNNTVTIVPTRVNVLCTGFRSQ